MVHPNSKIAHRSIKSTGTDKLHREVILRAMKTCRFVDDTKEPDEYHHYAGTAIGIAIQTGSLDRYQVSRRMSELIRDGLVTELDVVYKPDNGRPQAVFQLTQKGVDCLEGGKL